MSNKSNLPFNKNNYKLMIIGVLIIFMGFFIMTLDNEEYGYGFLGLTLGPIIVLFGFIFEFFAIFLTIFAEKRNKRLPFYIQSPRRIQQKLGRK